MKITAKAISMKKAGMPVISLSAGEPDFPTPKIASDAGIKAIRDGFTNYTVNSGTIELKKAICHKLKRDNGLEYVPENIIVSNGGKQAIANTILALCERGDEVIIPSPYWVSFPEMVSLADATSVVLNTTIEDGFKIKPSGLEKSISDRTKLLILNSPSNPTGAVYSKKEIELLMEVVKSVRRDIFVLSDEMYEQLMYGDAEYYSPARIQGMREKTIVSNAVSKTFSMTGWRVGYIAAPEWIVDACNKIQSQTTSNASSISQKAAEAALLADPSIINEMKRAFKERRDFMFTELNKISGFNALLPDGAFYIFPSVADLIGKTISGCKLSSSMDVGDFLLEKGLIATVPGEAFGAADLYVVIMAGGSGTRLWPMSRREYPKQFIDFLGTGTLIQQTVQRLDSLVSNKNILIVTNDIGEQLVKEQLPFVPQENVVVEPTAKNTAPCIALAAAIIKKRNPNAIMIVLPSDHIITDVHVFQQTLRAAVFVAFETMSLVTIGVIPTRPETGYGYIQKKNVENIQPAENELEKNVSVRFGVDVRKVKTFAEKPDVETAKAFIESGEFFWNSGMFVWHIDAIWRELESAMPHLFEDLKSMYHAIGTSKEEEVLRKIFTWVKSTSIDYGVMEKAMNVYMVEGRFFWSDAGSWDELAKLSQESPNSFSEFLILKNAKNVSFLKTSNKMRVAVIGVEDIIVVETADALLICKKGESQKVKDIVSMLKESSLNEYL
ncbi:hypothetical protein CHS0354_023974 [Potamilus streckersoni]|uniref:Uncharacterized protein n=1 Tax=Potamilus streckersoni TaxID=2493646 RepID=A0AAE0RZL2_9BIVA|nr:hypothetical protein CHS0354_023974 [Potamilus streckersoni]